MLQRSWADLGPSKSMAPATSTNWLTKGMRAAAEAEARKTQEKRDAGLCEENGADEDGGLDLADQPPDIINMAMQCEADVIEDLFGDGEATLCEPESDDDQDQGRPQNRGEAPREPTSLIPMSFRNVDWPAGQAAAKKLKKEGCSGAQRPR